MTTAAASLPAADPTPRAATAAAHVEAVEHVVHEMRRRLGSQFTHDDMARVAHLSPYHFNRVFRSVTGVPPGRFHAAVRMDAAKRLLLTTDLRVTDVCLDVGYRSLGTFTTQFRELVGLSPTELRCAGRRLEREGVGSAGVADLVGSGCAPESCARAAGAGGEMLGTVVDPTGGGRLVFVGAFAEPSPQGLPAACTIVSGEGPFRLAAVPPGHRFVAAVAFGRSLAPRDYVMPSQDALLVASAEHDPARGLAAPLVLRPLRDIDPPVVLAPLFVLRTRLTALAGG